MEDSEERVRSGQWLQTPQSHVVVYANEGTVAGIRIGSSENPLLIELSLCNFLPSELAAKLGSQLLVERCLFNYELCGSVGT